MMGFKRVIVVYDDDGEPVREVPVTLKVVTVDGDKRGMDQHLTEYNVLRRKYPHYRVTCYDPETNDIPFMAKKEVRDG